MSKLTALMVLAFLAGCGGSKHPLSTDDGGAGSTGSGTGGTVSGGGGAGGSTSTGGNGTGTGGLTGGGGSQGGGGTQGGGGLGGALGGLADAGLGGLLADGGLNGILDSGVIGGCPANPMGQACGGAGTPAICLAPAVDGGMPLGCFCANMQWTCINPGTLPGGRDGGGGGFTAPPCPANAMGMSCTAGSLCMTPGGGCFCVGFGGAPTWRCM
jgi:hypothetical protein